MIAAYLVASVALAAPGERRPGLGSVVIVARVAGLVGFVYLVVVLPGEAFIFDGEPSSWLPFAALAAVALTVLLVRRRPAGWRQAQRHAVVATAPFVLVAGAFALLVWLVPDVRWERWLPIPVLAAGLVLLALPRATLVRAAIPAAVTFGGLFVLLSGTGARLDGGVGDSTIRPRTAAEVPRELRRGIGSAELDLTGLDRVPQRLALDASVGVGTLEVAVPPRTVVEADVKLGHGHLVVDDPNRRGEIAGEERLDIRRRNGRVTARGAPFRYGRRPPKPRMRLRLRLRGGIGELRVRDGSHSTRWRL